MATKRISRLRGLMVSAEVDALLITDEINVRYLTGFTGDSTALLVTGSEAWLISDRRYEQQLAEECPAIPVAIRGPEKRAIQLMAETIVSLSLTRVSFEADAMSWQVHRTLSDATEGVTWEPSAGLVGELRVIKEPGEVDTIRSAVRCAERAFGVLTASLQPGMTELEAAYLLESSIRSFGGEGVGFGTIIAVGPAAALPHYRPGTNPISAGRGLLVDWGAKVDGYTSDMTRTLSVGSVSQKMREIYPIVLEAHQSAAEALRPGTRLCDVDAAARDVIKRHGYGDAFGHGLGHGIGLQVHEQPRLASIEEAVLEAGMVVTIEPGIYLPGELGVRIEDDYLLTDVGSESLCSLPKGLEENQVLL